MLPVFIRKKELPQISERIVRRKTGKSLCWDMKGLKPEIKEFLFQIRNSYKGNRIWEKN